MYLVGFMTPSGYQYPPPTSGPRGAARVNMDPARGSIHLEVDFAGVMTPEKARRFYVVAGDKIIGFRDLPPSTDDTITESWVAPPQVVQAIVANPSNAIVYVEAPANTLPREYLPGGVVLNGGSPWAQFQPPPPSDTDANL
jgi:hypothetical protein